MGKIIGLFNNKGGVSKTTTTYGLGWAVAELGKRVLIVDTDPQCNLTGTVLGFDDYQQFTDFYTNNPRSNILSCLRPVLQGLQAPLVPADPVATRNPNLSLLAGHIELAENEPQFAVALSTGSTLPALQNIPGSVGALLRLTAADRRFDAIFVDMSPSLGALNQCILFGCDYFIVPTSPDYYCDQAVAALARVLPKWHQTTRPFANPAMTYPFSQNPPKFLGNISQRFRPRHGQPTSGFQRWINIISASVDQQLVPALLPLGMSLTGAQFTAGCSTLPTFNLSNVADFNNLITQSQAHNVPAFALSDAEIEHIGVVLDNMKASRDAFRTTFEKLARDVVALAGI